MKYAHRKSPATYAVVLAVGASLGFFGGVFFVGGARSASAIFNTVELVYSAGESGAAGKVSAGKDGFFLSGGGQVPNVGAEAYAAADLDSGFVFFEKNGNGAYPIASVTKLMTALVSEKIYGEKEPVSVNESDVAVYGDTGLLRAGEYFTVRDILPVLLVPSSNDAAFALARRAGVSNFVKKMNETARDIGMKHTSFTDPSGLHRGNKSSPNDLLALLRHINKNNPDILRITALRDVAVSAGVLKNYNWKAGDGSFIGGKSGRTDAALNAMAGVFSVPFENLNRRVGVVVLKTNDRKGDVRALLRWVKENYSYGADAARSEKPQKTAKSGRFTMMFVGDVMMDRGVEYFINKNGGGDFHYPFEYMRDELARADILFGNLEGPISDSGRKRGSIYSFRMDPLAAPALGDTGFDVVSLANNHSGDYGRDALLDTFSRLDAQSIRYVGAGYDERQIYEPVILKKNGTKVGFLAFSDVGPNWFKAGAGRPGIAIAGGKIVTDSVRHADGLVDILVVSFHFGDEYKTRSNERQRRLARLAVDSGADLVVGHHPHVVQEIEQYKGVGIVYSLGNFVFDQAFSSDTKKGIAVEAAVEGKRIVSIKKIQLRFNGTFQPVISN